MSYRVSLVLGCLGVVLPLACGHTSASPPNGGQGGKSLGGDAGAVAGAGSATVAGGAAALGGTTGTGTGGTVAAGAGGTVTDALEPSGGAAQAGEAGSEGEAGAPPLPLEQPSCQALPLPCGQAQTSCCTATEVPGGAFTRYDANQATVSDFRLDKFEVTVGRFRAFVEHYPDDLPAPHSGKNPHDAQDSGWDPSWNAQLLPSSTALTSALACSLRFATWDDEPASNENRPINCMTWYEAEAFCIWDGGRLPSDLEWEYAARGGAEGRHVPWGNSNEPNAVLANYRNFCETDPQMLRPECNGIAQIWLVGSAPAGDARWGQSDLAGNLWEYTVDYFGPALDCSDCARHVPTPPGTGQYAVHVSRGGAYEYDLGDGLWDRDFYYPSEPRFAALGFRCAYDAQPK